MINIEAPYLEFVLSILKKIIPNHRVLLFGSRVTEKIKPYSDIDLAIMTEKPLDIDTMTQLSLAFSDSDLPYKVDLVDWATIDEDFKKIILARCEVIRTGKNDSD